MIIWQNHKAGFVGAQKFFISGVFSVVYAAATAVAVAPPAGPRDPGSALPSVTIGPAQLARREHRELLLQEDEEILVIIHAAATALSERDN